jgi:homoserine kinase type II
MTAETAYRRVILAYPPDCAPSRVAFLAGAGGFSGALFWRLETERGPLCLRCWPREHPSRERLEFIQAVLWHVHQEGFRRLPLPLETRSHAGYIREAGRLWELAPWLPGTADYRRAPSPNRLRAAMTTLAEFHVAAATFPLPDRARDAPPGIRERLERLRVWPHGRLQRLSEAVAAGDWPEMALRARHWLTLAPKAIPRVQSGLVRAAEWTAPLQPCIRDIWHDHVLFDGEQVSGLVDFGALRPDSVAADLGRLLGSLAGDDRQAWHDGLEAYATVRPLSAEETALATVFDQANTLLAGLSWLEWIYLEDRHFGDRGAVLARLDENLPRLAALAGLPPQSSSVASE